MFCRNADNVRHKKTMRSGFKDSETFKYLSEYSTSTQRDRESDKATSVKYIFGNNFFELTQNLKRRYVNKLKTCAQEKRSAN